MIRNVLLAFWTIANLDAATEPSNEAISDLESRDLLCSSCVYIFHMLDEQVKREDVAEMTKKKAKKWLKRSLEPKNVCRPDRFTENMGMSNRIGKHPRRLYRDAVEFARKA